MQFYKVYKLNPVEKVDVDAVAEEILHLLRNVKPHIIVRKHKATALTCSVADWEKYLLALMWKLLRSKKHEENMSTAIEADDKGQFLQVVIS